MSMSSGFRISAMFTIEETETLPSLMLSAAMCEWQSIMPGITNCPAASITCASFGALTDTPTSAILPSLIRMEPCSMFPCETVRIVAFRITMTAGTSGGAAAAINGKQRIERRLANRTFFTLMKNPNEPFTGHLQRGRRSSSDRGFYAGEIQRDTWHVDGAL